MRCTRIVPLPRRWQYFPIFCRLMVFLSSAELRVEIERFGGRYIQYTKRFSMLRAVFSYAAMEIRCGSEQIRIGDKVLLGEKVPQIQVDKKAWAPIGDTERLAV